MPNIAPTVHLPVSVVIVNWRALDETLAAVECLRLQTSALHRVYIVDNGSADGSLQRLEEAFSGIVEFVVLANPTNTGFGGGCNRALQEAIHDGCAFIWLLNNDARPESYCLGALLSAAADNPSIGMVGSWMTDPDQQSNNHSGSWMRPWLLSCGSVRTTLDLERYPYSWVTAASVLVRTEALFEIGLFDEAFFMYWEDADLAMRIRYAGYRIVIAQDAHVVHRAGTSSATIPVQRYLWHLRSQGLWLRKHHSHPTISTFLLNAKFLVKALIDKDIPRFKAVVRAILFRGL